MVVCSTIVLKNAQALNKLWRHIALLAESDSQHLVADAMPIRWAFECLLRAEHLAVQQVNNTVRGPEKVIGFESDLQISVLILSALAGAFLLLTVAALQLRVWRSA